MEERRVGETDPTKQVKTQGSGRNGGTWKRGEEGLVQENRPSNDRGEEEEGGGGQLISREG